MSTTQIPTWADPTTKIWGFHCHQELPLDQFAEALVVQQNCAQFLKAHNIPIDAADAVKPGYGPHLGYMWELRIETSQEDVLEQLGLAVSYLAINRFGMSGYLHPLMHNPNLDEDLATEGRDNQGNTIWFGYKVPQNQEFFFNPPRDEHNQIIDSRTPRVMTDSEKQALMAKANKLPFRDPQELIAGFHVHMDFAETERKLALAVYDQLLPYLSDIKMLPSSTRVYDPGENGPHLSAGWEVKFEGRHKDILRKIGLPIGWLMCNRQGMPVFMHPVTWKEGDISEELFAHRQYSFFIGELPALDLSFFSNQIETR